MIDLGPDQKVLKSRNKSLNNLKTIFSIFMNY